MRNWQRFFRLGLAASLNMTLQFAFHWYLITFFGAGIQSDIFFGTMALPQFVLLVLTGSLSLILVPALAQTPGEQFKQECWNYLYATLFSFLFIGILAFITAACWVPLLLPGFKEEGLHLAINLSRIQLGGMVFNAVMSILIAAHSARENFLRIEITSTVANVVSLVLFYFSLEYVGIYAAAWVTVLRIFLQTILLIPFIGKPLPFHWRNTTFQISWKKLKPLIIGNAYLKTDNLVDKYLTSKGLSGELTLVNLAQQLYFAFNSILVKILVNTMIPSLAKHHFQRNEKVFFDMVNKRILITLLAISMGFLLLWTIGPFLLHWSLSFKNFDTASIHKLWIIMMLMYGLLGGGVLGSIVSSTFYARGDTRTPTLIGTLLFTIYIPIKILSFVHYGVYGLALSVTIYYFSSFLIQYFIIWKLKKKAFSQMEIS